MDELLKKYEIEEVSKKTSISPIFLQKLMVENFDTINELKFKGFLKILKSEFKDIDFSDLEEKANGYYFVSDNTKKTGKQQIVEKLDLNEDNKSYKGYFFVFILIVIIGILLYYMKNNEKLEVENNNTNLMSLKVEKIVEKNDTNISNSSSFEENKSEENSTNKNIIEENETKLINNVVNIEKNSSKKYINTNLTIEPLRKVWFKVYYIDLNKSKEFLTSESVDLNASKKMFIKFGHGMIKLFYKGKTIFPNSKKITRVILKDGKMTITNKKVEEFR